MLASWAVTHFNKNEFQQNLLAEYSCERIQTDHRDLHCNLKAYQ